MGLRMFHLWMIGVCVVAFYGCASTRAISERSHATMDDCAVPHAIA